MCSECFEAKQKEYPDLEEADCEDDLDREAARDPREDTCPRDQDEDTEQPCDEGEDRSDDEGTEDPTEI